MEKIPEPGNTGKKEPSRNEKMSSYEEKNLDLLEKICLEIAQNDQISDGKEIFDSIEETKEIIKKWREYYPLLHTALSDLSHEELVGLIYWLGYGETLYYGIPSNIKEKFATDIANNQFFPFLRQVQNKVKSISKTLEKKELIDLLSFDNSKHNLFYQKILKTVTTLDGNIVKLLEKIKNLKENLGEIVFDLLKKQQIQKSKTGASHNGTKKNEDPLSKINATYREMIKLERELAEEQGEHQRAENELRNAHKGFNSKKITWPQDLSRQWKLHDLIMKQLKETQEYLVYSDEKLPPRFGLIRSSATESNYLMDLKHKKIWNIGEDSKEIYHLDPFHLLIFEKPYPGIEGKIESSLREMIEHFDLTVEGNPEEYKICFGDFLDFIQPSELKDLIDISFPTDDGDSPRYEDDLSNVEKEISIEDHTKRLDGIAEFSFQGSIAYITSVIAESFGKRIKEVILLTQEGDILPLSGWMQIEEPQHYKQLFDGKPAIWFKGETLSGQTLLLISNGESFEFFETP